MSFPIGCARDHTASWSSGPCAPASPASDAADAELQGQCRVSMPEDVRSDPLGDATLVLQTP